MKKRNPWSSRWVDMAQSEHGLEKQAMIREAYDAASVEPIPCDVPGCTGTAFYRVAVGGWWCDLCGKLVQV